VEVGLIELEPVLSGVYYFYADARRCEEVNMARKMMKRKRISKKIGDSSVKMKLLFKIHLLSQIRKYIICRSSFKPSTYIALRCSANR
jgi:hypothetical protein